MNRKWLLTFLVIILCAVGAMGIYYLWINRHGHLHQDHQLEGTPPSQGSIYWADRVWRTKENNEFHLKSLQGSPVIIAMLYTNCTTVCPMLMTDLKKIEADLGDGQRKKMAFVVVSFDSKKDTPPVLKKFSEKTHTTHWKYLYGNPSQVLELANLLGVRYKELPNGDFVHSVIITLLNRNGEVAFQHEGLGKPVVNIKDHLRKQ